MDQKFTLLELNKSIQEKLNLSFPESVWVIAEISELKINRNGHCYLELVEKDAITDNIIAKSRATIWAFTFRMLQPYFEKATGRELSPGIKILIKVNIEFHELYGLSLNISDIDPNYTLGDLAQKKIEILRKLEDEGVINTNKELTFPLVPQKIAIISSDTAAGYQDFINQLENNSFGYKFYSKLFPSIMQGLKAEESIINVLERIYNYEDFFDIVVIIRGGGSQADLGCFDNYLLTTNIAQFPLPILTGIGHDKDESITDIVAHKKLKTPTAVAEFIIEKTSVFEDKLIISKDRILNKVSSYLQEQKSLLSQIVTLTAPSARNKIDKHNYELKLIFEKLQNNLKQFYHKKANDLTITFSNIKKGSLNSVYNESYKLNFLIKQIRYNSLSPIHRQLSTLDNLKNKSLLLDPENILKRGYSITYHNGKKITDVSNIHENDEILTKLFSGIIRSTIKEKSKKGIHKN
ncbi:exodeoxyribonuclease VII large subunit [Bacteroidota bacterium]